MPDGDVVESDRFMVAICTCRRSGDYPLCDTSHRRCRNLKSPARRVNREASAATSDPAATTP
ncbi:CDGSH iron-sulfur domain-containing protein [Mycobacterium sp. 050134]|uniref:CDGSH iron-sulfur domain-containing protein n=1 Tax=Mycobacterium sp. 050134 TaxID=3096111 RepID=UPI002EDB9CB5